MSLLVDQKLKNLLQFGNDKLLANTAILEILLNGEINDYTHNRRLAIDVWSGKKHIIPHDFIYNRKKILEEAEEEWLKIELQRSV